MTPWQGSSGTSFGESGSRLRSRAEYRRDAVSNGQNPVHCLCWMNVDGKFDQSEFTNVSCSISCRVLRCLQPCLVIPAGIESNHFLFWKKFYLFRTTEIRNHPRPERLLPSTPGLS